MKEGGLPVHVRPRKILVRKVTRFWGTHKSFEEKNVKITNTFTKQDPIFQNSNPKQNQSFCTRHVHVYCTIKRLCEKKRDQTNLMSLRIRNSKKNRKIIQYVVVFMYVQIIFTLYDYRYEPDHLFQCMRCEILLHVIFQRR